MVALTFDVKLKEGFFKTGRYKLTIGQKQILLSPQEDLENDRIIISDKILKSVFISHRNLVSGEFEIITQDNIYVGTFTPQTNMEKVYQSFIKEFSNKIVLQ